MRGRLARIAFLSVLCVLVALVAIPSLSNPPLGGDTDFASSSDDWARNEPLLKLRTDGGGFDLLMRTAASDGIDEAGAVFRALLYKDPVGVSVWARIVSEKWAASGLVALNDDGSIDLSGLDRETIDDLNARLRYELVALRPALEIVRETLTDDEIQTLAWEPVVLPLDMDSPAYQPAGGTPGTLDHSWVCKPCDLPAGNTDGPCPGQCVVDCVPGGANCAKVTLPDPNPGGGSPLPYDCTVIDCEHMAINANVDWPF